MSRYREYNITDVIVFDTYDEIYLWLYDVWQDSTKIHIDTLKDITRLLIRNIETVKEHEEYFYYCKSLVDAKKHEIGFPSYFIQREAYSEIENKFENGKIHLIVGSRFSGRSYFLAALYRKFSNSGDVYYFDSRNAPSENAVDYLLKQKSSIQLYDVGSLKKNIFQKIVKDVNSLARNQNTVVLVLGHDTTEFMDFVKDFMRENPSSAQNIVRHELANRFNHKDLQAINAKLPIVSIPPFNAGTILDNLIRIPEEMQRRGKFSREHLEIDDEKDLVLLLILAIKESISSRDVEKFGVQKQLYKYLTKYNWFLEAVERSSYSKSAGDNSSFIYTVNSRYWLSLELGNYVRNVDNISSVVAAYVEIVKSCIRYRKDSSSSITQYRSVYKPYIQFNAINAIFLTHKGGQLYLPLKIYEALTPYLATDFQFIHQFSKCCLRYSYLLEGNEKARIEQLEEAQKKVNLAKSMLCQVMEKSENEGLKRSLAHFEYTQATIQCELFRLKYSVEPDAFESTVQAVYDAIISPYNTDDYKNDSSRSQGIKTFIQSMAGLLAKMQNSVQSDTLTKVRNIQQIAKNTESGNGLIF